MWNDEEEPQWGVDEPEEVKPEEKPAEAAAAEGAAAEGEAPKEGAAEEPGSEDNLYKIPTLFKHWVRPKFLQYNYIYDYRKNYYDDVIDFMDRRSHGITRDLPKPQTWGERVLRTYTQRLGKTASASKKPSDEQLIHNLHTIQAIHHYHIKDYYHKSFQFVY